MTRMEALLIGYSGHAYVVYDILIANNYSITKYFDSEEKKCNPLDLIYLGSERSIKSIEILKDASFFISIGNNEIRNEVFHFIKKETGKKPINVIHPSSVLGKNIHIENGIMIGANCIINPLARISDGVICNTGSIIEHECRIGRFSHVAPGAVLAGNVTIGKKTFVGANSVIKEGISVGNNATIGAGSVVVSDIPDNVIAFGNPCKIFKPK